MIACALSAIYASVAIPSVQWFIVVLWVVLYSVLVCVVGWLERKRSEVEVREG